MLLFNNLQYRCNSLFLLLRYIYKLTVLTVTICGVCMNYMYFIFISGNVLSWDGLVADSTIRELALDGLLNRYLILGLMNSAQGVPAIAKCQAIAASFPRSWFNSLSGDNTLPQLENFCRHLLNVARSFDKGIRSEKDAERRAARDNIKQITKILVNIHATNHALTLGEQFSFKV